MIVTDDTAHKVGKIRINGKVGLLANRRIN